MKTSQYIYRFLGLLVLVILTATGCKINDTTTIEPSQKTEFTDLQVNPDFKFDWHNPDYAEVFKLYGEILEGEKS